VCQPTSCNASQIQQIESLDYSHIQIGKIIPDVYNYKNVRTFSRLALLNIDGQSSLVTATMGVWN
jgi:hypothetical protein